VYSNKTCTVRRNVTLKYGRVTIDVERKQKLLHIQSECS